MGDAEKALFGVFDGHGGREVAVYTRKHYEQILGKDYDDVGQQDEREWLRQSFLKVDEELKTPKGQNEVGDLRREKPPKKPAILNILGDDKDKKDPSE